MSNTKKPAGKAKKSGLAERMSVEGINKSNISMPKGYNPKNVPPMTGSTTKKPAGKKSK